MMPRRAIVAFAAAVLGIAALSALLNFIWNPLGVFRHDSPDWLHGRPDENERIRLAKAIAVVDRAPRTVIVGNSRANYGLDPDHPSLRRSGPAYNLAFGSQSLTESLAYLSLAHRASPLERVIVGLDLRLQADVNPTFDLALLCGQTGICLPDLLIARHLLSPAWPRALQHQLRPKEVRVRYLVNGLRDPDWNIAFVQKAGGSRQAFLRHERNALRRADPNSPFVDPQGPKALRDLLAFLYVQGIKADLVIEPTHMRRWALYARTHADALNGTEASKRLVVRLNAELAATHGRAPFPVWDFSAAHTLTTEPLPAGDDVMRWHWESDHHRKELGDLVLARIAGDPAAPPDFGRPLEPATLDATLADWRRGYDAWTTTMTDLGIGESGPAAEIQSVPE